MLKYFALSGLTVLRVYRHMRISYCDFREVNEVLIRKPNDKEIEYLRTSSELFAGTISVLADSRRPQRRTKDLQFNYHSGNWNKSLVSPETSNPLYLPDNCLLVSPGMLLIQLASILPIEQLFLLAMEFGGTYVISPNEGCTYHDRKPILSSKDLDYAAKLARRSCKKGSKSLTIVSKYFKINSASPMESCLLLNLSFPTVLGGYGISDLQLNYKILLSWKAAQVSQQSKVIVDLYHLKSKTVIEYDSRSYHSEVDQSQKDKRRRDGLELDRYHCFSITTQQYNNYYSYSACICAIVEMIKGRNRIRVKNFSNKSYKLYLRIKRANELLSKL